MSVHLNIKKIRELKGIARNDMASMLGITLNGYGKIERGEVDISIKRLYQLADIFQLTVIDFFDEKDCLVKLLTRNCKDTDHCEPIEGKEGITGFDSQMYIEFLEQRIAWLKAQLASQTANEVES